MMKYPAVIRFFTLVIFSMPPIVGSVASVVWHGGALWSVFEIATGRRRLSRDRAMLVVAGLFYLFIAVNILSFLANGPDWALAYKLLPMVTFALLPFSYSLWVVSRKDEVARAILNGCAIACVGALAVALVQDLWVGIRPEGGAGNALVFAHVTVLAAAVCLAGALTIGSDRRVLYFLAFAAGVMAILYSQSRSIWITTIVLTALILFVCRRELQRFSRKQLLAAMGVIILVGAVSSGIMIVRLEELYVSLSQFLDRSNQETSAGYRLILWQLALELFSDKPMIGYGIQNTRQLIAEYAASDFSLETGFTHFHNGFLTLLVENGLMGLSIILAVLAFVFAQAIRMLRKGGEPIVRFAALLLLIATVGYAVSGSANIVLGHDIMDTVFVVFLIVGLYLGAGRSVLDEAVADPRRQAADVQ